MEAHGPGLAAEGSALGGGQQNFAATGRTGLPVEPHGSLGTVRGQGARPIIILESDALCLGPWKESWNYHEHVVKIAYKFNLLRPNKRTGQWSPGATGYHISPQGAALLLGYVAETSALEADKLLGTRIVQWTHGPRLFDINTRSYSRSSTRSKSLGDYERLIGKS